MHPEWASESRIKSLNVHYLCIKSSAANVMSVKGPVQSLRHAPQLGAIYIQPPPTNLGLCT